jgi:hypothetical protein
VVVTLGWYESGPGRRGWARRAGTPVALIAHRTVIDRKVASASSASVPTLPSPPFTARFQGRLRQSASRPGRVLIDISGRTNGGAAGRLWIRLQGVPIGEGVSMTASGASFGPAAWPNEYVGNIASLEGTRLMLSLHGQSGGLAVLVDLSINQSTGAVKGLLRAEPGPGDAQ